MTAKRRIQKFLKKPQKTERKEETTKEQTSCLVLSEMQQQLYQDPQATYLYQDDFQSPVPYKEQNQDNRQESRGCRPAGRA